jgi:hypothetical protein
LASKKDINFSSLSIFPPTSFVALVGCGIGDPGSVMDKSQDPGIRNTGYRQSVAWLKFNRVRWLISFSADCAVRMTQKLEKIHPPKKLETENSGTCLPAFGFKITREKLPKFTEYITEYCKN